MVARHAYSVVLTSWRVFSAIVCFNYVFCCFSNSPHSALGFVIDPVQNWNLHDAQVYLQVTILFEIYPISTIYHQPLLYVVLQYGSG